jgi:hypothetical protein
MTEFYTEDTEYEPYDDQRYTLLDDILILLGTAAVIWIGGSGVLACSEWGSWAGALSAAARIWGGQ